MKTLLNGSNAYKIIKNERKNGALSHAYLLVYPDERNLRSVLKEFAKVIINADARKASLIDKDSFTDCLIYPEEGKRLNTENANSAVAECMIKPVESDVKLFVFDKFHDASVSVQNKLLKMLEEPPQGVIFLLGAISDFSILPTVKSRVKRLEIQPFSEEEVGEYLKRIYPDGDYSSYAAASNGIPGNAQNLIDGGYYGKLLKCAVEFAQASEQNIPFLVSKISEIKQKGEFLSVLRLVFRDMMVYNLRNGSVLLKSESESIKKCAQNYSLKGIISVLDGISSAEKDVKFNANFSMLMESLLINAVKEKK